MSWGEGKLERESMSLPVTAEAAGSSAVVPAIFPFVAPTLQSRRRMGKTWSA